MLNFRTAYLMTMREQAPKMFRELRKQGTMDAHLDAKWDEAREMYASLTEGAKTLPSGVLADLSLHRWATELVYANLIEFSSEAPE